ncbi:cop9 signalosome complex subunit [Chytridiales sp. JEL 0842]|nr:cop9 signalosome complex subunit [Chytridiales sp. JEL 0842]
MVSSTPNNILTPVAEEQAIDPHDIDFTPHTSSDSKDFFQSDRDIALQKAKEEKKAKLTASPLGNPISVPSKILDLHVIHPRSNRLDNTLASLSLASADAKDSDASSSGFAFTAESGHVARRINLKTGKQTTVYKGHTGPVTCLTVSHSPETGKEEFLYTGSWDKTIRKWNVRSGECVQVFKGHNDFVKSLALYGPILLSGSSDSTIKKWNAQTGELLATWKGHTMAVEALTIDFDPIQGGGPVVYSGSSDTFIRKWDLETGKELGVLSGHLTSVYGLLLSDGDLWSVSADRTAKRWNLETESPDTSFEHPDFVKSIAVMGQFVATGSRDECIRIWNTATEKCVHVIEAHFGEVSSMSVSAGKLWTASHDNTLRSWSISELEAKLSSRDPDVDRSAAAAAEKDAAVEEKPKVNLMTEEEERELAELMGDDFKFLLLLLFPFFLVGMVFIVVHCEKLTSQIAKSRTKDDDGTRGIGNATQEPNCYKLTPSHPHKPPPKKTPKIIVRNPTLDLDVYINNYTGHTKVSRLEFISDVCPDLQIDALHLAVAEVKQNSLNVPKYNVLLTRLNECLASRGRVSVAADAAWMEATTKGARARTDKLETELKTYKNNLIKESIRMGHHDLGDHYYNAGDLTNALKCYSRTRDYTTTSKHIIDMCLNVIKVALEIGNYSHVQSYVVKAESTADIPDKVVVLGKLKCCSGLVQLESGKFKAAANAFLEVPFELGSNYSEVISPNDIAIYGTLCALASFERGELKAKILENSAFKQYLELEPQVRELLYGFYNSKYSQCLDIMEKLRSDFLLDMYLHPHVDSIYKSIRRKALAQYFSPFMTVDLNKMATTFNCTTAELEQELAAAIVDNQIQARIDTHNRVLRVKQADQRSTVYRKTLAMGEEYQRQVRLMLLRVNLLKQDLRVIGGPKDDREPQIVDEHMM